MVSPGYCSAESHCSSGPSAVVVSPAPRTARCSGHPPRAARRPSLRSRCRASRNNCNAESRKRGVRKCGEPSSYRRERRRHVSRPLNTRVRPHRKISEDLQTSRIRLGRDTTSGKGIGKLIQIYRGYFTCASYEKRADGEFLGLTAIILDFSVVSFHSSPQARPEIPFWRSHKSS